MPYDLDYFFTIENPSGPGSAKQPFKRDSKSDRDSPAEDRRNGRPNKNFIRMFHTDATSSFHDDTNKNKRIVLAVIFCEDEKSGFRRFKTFKGTKK